jgi:hypothetical protein
MSTSTLNLIDATATLTITWSESDQLQKTIGRPLPLAYGAAILEAEYIHEVIKREGRGGYCKTGFLISYTLEGETQTYEGRYDLGCDAPTLAEHIEGAIAHRTKRHSEDVDEFTRNGRHLIRCIDAQRHGRQHYIA